MLVAAPGQAAAYSIIGNNAQKKTCISSSATPKSTASNSLVTNSNCSSNSATLMKTISVRLNRGTEFLKDTVQKALITNASSSKTTSNTASNKSFINTNIKHFTTNAIATLNHIKATSVHNVEVPSTDILENKSSHASALTAAVSSSSNTLSRASISVNTSYKPFKLKTFPPTNIHRYPQERDDTSSTDSINKELFHFKPILSAPTMRWKCSKSRGGVSIKMPIACLAANIKNLNCDDCSIRDRGSSEGEQRVTNNEQLTEVENNKYKCHIYRPNPSSTLLTTIITSPTHQSAFVRLVAQMKTLVNLQQTTKERTHSLTSQKEVHYKMHQAIHRNPASKPAVALKMSKLSKSPLTQISLRSRKQASLRMMNNNFSTELDDEKCKSNAAPKSSSKPTKTVKDKKITKTIPLHISTNKNKRKTNPKVMSSDAFARKESNDKTDSKTNIISAGTPNIVTHNQRKRKIIEVSNSAMSSEKAEKKTDLSELDTMPPLRKSVRLSKEESNDFLIGTVKRIIVKRRKTQAMSKRSANSFSPPMTRSRLKELMQQHSITSDACKMLGH